MSRAIAATFLATLVCQSAWGQIVVPGADGSDGAFNPTSNVTVDLSLAPDGTWNGPNASPGNGVYDVNKWAIVFRYSSVNIPANVTVAFANHDWNGLKPGNPPVVWLVSGAVTINGLVRLDSAGSLDSLNFYPGGPGGFRGNGTNNIGGLGPGGSDGANGANYASGSRAYGNARCLPLIGGSGGGPGNPSNVTSNGGAGAILIAAPGTITLNGTISAYSNSNNGSGGAIRVVSNRLEGSGGLYAYSYLSNMGRIRIEANQLAFGHVGYPTASFGLPGPTAQIWPEDVMAAPPSVRVVSLGVANIPSNPAASFAFPNADVTTTNGIGQVLVIEAHNVPTGSDPVGTQAWNVVARVAPRGSGAFTVNATYVSGNYATSIWNATLNLPTGFAAIQVRASMPPQ